MSTEEAKRRAKKKFIAEKLEGITFRVPVGQKSRIQEPVSYTHLTLPTT